MVDSISFGRRCNVGGLPLTRVKHHIGACASCIPTYDADGNQTRVQTRTGIWAVNYDAENRPTDFTKVDSSGCTISALEFHLSFKQRAVEDLGRK